MIKKITSVLLCICFTAECFAGINTFASTEDSISNLLNYRENTGGDITDTVSSAASIADFTDVKEDDWFYVNLEYLVAQGLIKGKTQSTFEPSGSFSYAECSAIIVRYLNLEKEANKRQAQIILRNPEMKNLWYAGYFEVLGNLGLFEDYGIFVLEDGLIASVDKQIADSPIQRYRFAESISMSFELNGSIKARNVFSETGGCGREFILGSDYNEEYLELYKQKISDFDQIPKQSREGVLKAYYNGIFCGDENGFFHPDSPLTRAEMAKVLSVIINRDLRVRLIDDGYANKVQDEQFHVDPFGVKTLDFDFWTSLLEKQSFGVTIQDGEICYTPSSNPLYGYATDVYLYRYDGLGFVLHDEWTLRKRQNNVLTLEGNNAKILLVLRNTHQNNRVEGVYTVEIYGGEIIKSQPNIRQMPTYAENQISAYFLYISQKCFT